MPGPFCAQGSHERCCERVNGDSHRRCRAAPVPAWAARRRPGGRRGARRAPRHPVDQEVGEGRGDRPGDLDGRPDHARGRRHARQGPCAVRQGRPPRPGRRERAHGGGHLRLFRPGRRRRTRPGGQRHRGGERRDGLPVRAGAAGRQARRHAPGHRGRRGRDRHGDRPGRLPVRRLRQGLRRDRRDQGRVRRHAPEGHPGDRRAGHLRQRTPGVVARHDGGRGLHQDLHGQGEPGSDACRSRWSCSRPYATSASVRAARSA